MWAFLDRFGGVPSELSEPARPKACNEPGAEGGTTETPGKPFIKNSAL